MKKILKRYIAKTRVGICLGYIITNYLARIKMRIVGNKDIATTGGTSHTIKTLEDFLNYIQRVFEEYKMYGNINQFYGKVCEVGQGDQLGVALRLLADGAEEIDCADRFFSTLNATQHAGVYQALMGSNPKIANLLKNSDLTLPETFPNIKCYYGEQAAGEKFFLNKTEMYDFILSRAVLEHLDDPLGAIQSMYKALRPGGKLVHIVDFRDHGMFSTYGFDELTFLKIHSCIYKLMTYGTGRPNRILLPRYQALVSQLEARHQFFVTHLAYTPGFEKPQLLETINADTYKEAFLKIEQRKQHFSKAFRTMDNRDLLVSGILLVVEKPVKE